MFKEAIRRLARIIESGTRLRQDTFKISQINRGNDTTKRFQHKAAFRI